MCCASKTVQSQVCGATVRKGLNAGDSEGMLQDRRLHLYGSTISMIEAR